MKTTIDAAGRVVIPKQLREQAGLSPGTEIVVTFRDGVLEIEPAMAPVRVEMRGRWPVIVTPGPKGSITNELVNKLIEEGREERFRHHVKSK